jgi:hypothetical protein
MVFDLRDYENLIKIINVLEIMDNQVINEEFLLNEYVFHVHHIYMMTKQENHLNSYEMNVFVEDIIDFEDIEFVGFLMINLLDYMMEIMNQDLLILHS